MEDNIKCFLLTYITPLIKIWYIFKDLVTLPAKNSEEKVFSGKYFLPVDLGENLEGTLNIIQQVAYNMK